MKCLGDMAVKRISIDFQQMPPGGQTMNWIEPDIELIRDIYVLNKLPKFDGNPLRRSRVIAFASTIHC